MAPVEYSDDPKLLKWVYNQRAYFRSGKMDQEQKRMLDEIGLEFNPSKEENWDLQFKKLQDYFGKHGHCELVWAVDRFTFISNTPTNTSICLSSWIADSVPAKYKEDPKLGTWVSKQRGGLKHGIMDPERKRMLDEIGFVFNISKKEHWKLQFKKLQDYFEKHGHCELVWAADRFTFISNTPPTNTYICLSPWTAGNVPAKYEEDQKLANWVIKQRGVFKNGKMVLERKRMLEEIGFDSNPCKEENWNLQFMKLQDYYEEHGHCELMWAVDCFAFISNTPTNTSICLSPWIADPVPAKYKEDPQFANWASKQRFLFKNGRMDYERKKMLDEIGFLFNLKDNENKKRWNLQFKKLQDYIEEHGHSELFWSVTVVPSSKKYPR
jgi:hypothetical protein